MKRKMHEYDELKKELERFLKIKNKMWTIIKFDKKKLSFFEKRFANKIRKQF